MNGLVLYINDKPHRRLRDIPLEMRKDLDAKTLKAKESCRHCQGRLFTAKNLVDGKLVPCRCALIEVPGPGNPERSENG